MATRHAGEPHAWAIEVDAGAKSQLKPAALGEGTRVEVRDLFYATPARLKFLKLDRTEAEAVREMVRRLAMSRPDVAFTLAGEERSPVTFAAALPGATGRLARLGDVLGADFRANAVEIAAEREGIVIDGYAALPTLTRANALGQYLFVNGRPVRDKLLLGAVRAAYADYLPRDRHPLLALFVTLAAARGRRQRASGQGRGAVPQRRAGARADCACAEDGACPRGRRARQRPAGERPSPRSVRRRRSRRTAAVAGDVSAGMAKLAVGARAALPKRRRPRSIPACRPPICAMRPRPRRWPMAKRRPMTLDHPLGAARAQVHETYIVAQTRDGLVIVDQHAAHERIVYERLKAALEKTGVGRQILLIPEIVELDEADVERLAARAEELARFGLVLEAFGPGAVAVRETPSLLGEIDGAGLVRDLAEHMSEWDEALPLERRLMAVASSMACHGSVRAGRRLKPRGDERAACAKWKRRPIPANATTAARPMWSSSSATSSGCSDGAKAERQEGRACGSNRILLGATLAACFAALLCGRANAQDWPTRPVTMVVPFAPGGVYDTFGPGLCRGAVTDSSASRSSSRMCPAPAA